MTPGPIFVGAGYTGARVLSRLPEAVALGRSQPGDRRLDLDGDAKLSIALPADYDVIYSVPPSREAPTDVRLDRLLGQLKPAPARFV